MLLVRMYSKDQFGVWAQFLVVVGIVEISKLGFLKNAHIKIIQSVVPEEKPFVNTVSSLMNLVLSVVLGILLAIFAWFICPLYFSQELADMLLFYAASSILLSPLYQLQFIQFAEFDFKAIFISTVLRQGLFALFVLAIYVTNYPISMFTLSVVQFLVVIPTTILSYYLSRHYLRFSKAIQSKWLYEIFHYGKYSVGTNVSAIVFKSMDQLLIGGLTTSANVASYNNAIRISNLVEVPALSLSEVMFPKSVQSHQQEGIGAVKEMYEKSVASILCIIIPVTAIVMLFPEPIILILSGKKYLDVVPIVRVTMLYTFIVPFTLQFGTVMDSIGMPRINFLLITATMVLAAVLNYFAIPIWGVMGAAYGTLASYLFNLIVGQFILRKHVGVSFIATINYVPSFYKLGLTTLQKMKSQPK
jgi:O-antigen/teichoic acid export membrane protein